MKFFSADEKKTTELLMSHVDEVEATIKVFRKLLFAYLKGDETFRELIHEVHDAEHRADGFRREVERCIYRGSFLPVVREDYIMVAELTDKIADRTQLCGDIIALEEPLIPSELEEQMRDLVREVEVCFVPFSKLVKLENKSDKSQVTEYINRIEAGEQRVDRIEWNLIAELYRLEDYTLDQKIHLRSLICAIASIADCVEDVSDRMLILLTKEIF